jgi:hypothetical protein
MADTGRARAAGSLVASCQRVAVERVVLLTVAFLASWPSATFTAAAPARRAPAQLAVASESGDFGSVDLAFAQKGEAIAVWTRHSTLETSTSAAQGLRWTPSMELDEENMFQDTTLTASVAVDARGDAVATWERTGGPQVIEVAVRPAHLSRWRAGSGVNRPCWAAMKPLASRSAATDRPSSCGSAMSSPSELKPTWWKLPSAQSGRDVGGAPLSYRHLGSPPKARRSPSMHTAARLLSGKRSKAHRGSTKPEWFRQPPEQRQEARGAPRPPSPRTRPASATQR